MATSKFSRLPAVMTRTGLGRSTIYKKISEDEFPKPIHLGPRAVAWIDQEIDEWMQSCVDESRPHDDESGGA
jgi:prophage regulatory protein